jgi:hypothetical protein
MQPIVMTHNLHKEAKDVIKMDATPSTFPHAPDF